MKKVLAMVLALGLLLAAMIPALAENAVPQPEKGKKFDTNWAAPGAKVDIAYEEEGYRVEVNTYDNEHSVGNRYSYNCVYNEEKDVLTAISAEMVSYSYENGF